MLKIKVIEKSGAFIEYINDGEVLERLHLMGHGLPERWVEKYSGYDPADVLEEREVEVSPKVDAVMNDAGEIVQEEIPAVLRSEVKLKAEYTIEITDITAEVEQEKKNAEALAYLAETDWMIIRAMDSGEPCPDDVKQKRAAARASIVR